MVHFIHSMQFLIPLHTNCVSIQLRLAVRPRWSSVLNCPPWIWPWRSWYIWTPIHQIIEMDFECRATIRGLMWNNILACNSIVGWADLFPFAKKNVSIEFDGKLIEVSVLLRRAKTTSVTKTWKLDDDNSNLHWDVNNVLKICSN